MDVGGLVFLNVYYTYSGEGLGFNVSGLFILLRLCFVLGCVVCWW